MGKPCPTAPRRWGGGLQRKARCRQPSPGLAFTVSCSTAPSICQVSASCLWAAVHPSVILSLMGCWALLHTETCYIYCQQRKLLISVSEKYSTPEKTVRPICVCQEKRPHCLCFLRDTWGTGLTRLLPTASVVPGMCHQHSIPISHKQKAYPCASTSWPGVSAGHLRCQALLFTSSQLSQLNVIKALSNCLWTSLIC